jgi:hypothetical protein
MAQELESVKHSLNQAREAIKGNRNEEAYRNLEDALRALDKIVYDDH